MTALAVVEGSAVEVGSRTLTAEAARLLTEQAKGDALAFRARLLELYRGDAHLALGYISWADYCGAEFEMSKPHAHRVIDHVRVVEAVSLQLETEPKAAAPVTEGVARELSSLAKKDPVVAREVWSATVEQHGPKPTAAQVAEVRERIAPKKPKRKTVKPVAPAPEPRAKAMRPTQMPKDAELWTRRDIEAAQAIVDGKAAAVVGTQVGTWLEKYDDSIDVWVDRAPWVNPFVAGEDGDADEVVALFAEHVLPFKAMARVADLRGKALRFQYREGAEEHAQFLASLANGEVAA